MSWNVIKYKYYLLRLDPNQTDFLLFWKSALGKLKFSYIKLTAKLLSETVGIDRLKTNYNIVRVLALCQSYWAAMKKIFIYTRPCVNEMTWEFFTWLQSFCPVKLQCSFPFLSNIEETSEELPNFSMGIDLLGVDPTSNKNKAEKNSQVPRFANLSEA